MARASYPRWHWSCLPEIVDIFSVERIILTCRHFKICDGGALRDQQYRLGICSLLYRPLSRQVSPWHGFCFQAFLFFYRLAICDSSEANSLSDDLLALFFFLFVSKPRIIVYFLRPLFSCANHRVSGTLCASGLSRVAILTEV